MLGMLAAVGVAQEGAEFFGQQHNGGHPHDGGHDNDFGDHYDWLNPGGVTHYYSWDSNPWLYSTYAYPSYYYSNYNYYPYYYPYYENGVEMRPGEAEAEWLFNHGIGEPWVGGNPPHSRW